MNIRRWLKREYRMYLRRRNWHRAVQVMAMIVVFCTTYALILPAITMEKDTVCDFAEHTHGDGCYAQSTVCEKEEQSPHSHSEDCIGPLATLICKNTAAEHEHVATCYIYQTGRICGREETEGHSHTDSCFRRDLVCSLTEHTHIDSCYPATEPEATEETTEEPTLPEGDPTADLETPGDWEASLSSVTLTGSPAQDLLNVARSQLGYAENRKNYILDEMGNAFGYTRYGQWYGDPYGDWDAMFVSFCLHYAKVEGIGREQNSQVWLEALNGAGLYHEAGAHTPAAGDLIFFDRDSDGSCDSMGIVEAATADAVCVIAGDRGGRVDRFETHPEDASILGYCPLPEESDVTHTHSDGEGTQTQVILPGDTAVPADAALSVTAITENDAPYAAMAEQIRQALTGTVKQLTLLDISFYDAEGEYLSVSDTARVNIHFAGELIGSGKVKVFHFVDGAAVELEDVAVSHVAVAMQDGTEAVQTQLTFETDGFSVFAVVTVIDTSDRITVNDPAELAGNSYYIVSNNQNYVMRDSIYTATGRGLDRDTYSGKDSLPGKTTWTFTDAGDGTYYIHSNNGNYMVMEDSSADAAKVYLTANIDEATRFTVRAINGQAEISYAGPNSNKPHYLNVFNGNQDFCGWKDSGTQDGGSKVYLHIAEDVNGSYNLVTDLDGRSFAIVNGQTSSAMTTIPDTESVAKKAALDAQSVTILQSSGTTYINSSEDVPLWKFSAVDADNGVYTISTDINGETRYLNMTSEANGDLVLSTTPQNLTVSSTSNGKVLIGNGNTYLNSSGSDDDKDFWCYNGTDANSQHYLCEVVPDNSLLYNLNLPSGSWIDSNPRISSALQQIPADGTALLSVEGSNAVGSFVLKTMVTGSGRPTITNFYTNHNKNLGDALTGDNYLAPGAEYRFLGWQATVDGKNYLFPENASATPGDDGYIHITDADGVERALPPGTALTGKWERRCEVVLFFVNYGDTMLEKEDNKPIVDYNTTSYTDVVAIAHIYNPLSIDPSTYAGDEKNTIKKSNDALIQAEIVPKYDPSIATTQIVIDAVARFNDAGTGFDYVAVDNFNQTQLEASVGLYLRNDPDENTQIKLGNAYVDKSEITEDNYKLYWYLQKAVGSDAWHIDGVLVAKTQPMEIYKTFSGLTDDEAAGTINDMEFPLSLINAGGKASLYTTLYANSSQEGVYTNDGQQGAPQHIYKWTLQSVQGQRYAFAEEKYLVNGHDWSGLISVHYTDGSIEYQYNTDTTFAEDGDLFKDKPLIGGDVESVIFANFYTEAGTGMFSVSKVQAGNERNRLSGAEFTLTGKNGKVVATAKTNDNGAVHFADLEAGTYTLEETAAPTGYQKVNTKWTVEVSKSNDSVTVKIWEEGKATDATTLYDSKNGGIKEVYLVENEPESTTVTVNKYFTTITDAEVKELKDYRIEVQTSDGTVKSSLSLSTATPITGSINGYTWTVDLECGEDYTFVEKNYSHGNYLDTVVTAAVNGASAPVTKSENNSVASFPMTKSQGADTVSITNDYTNTFLLRIHKVDATDNNADMEGVKFNIYGDFQFHTKPAEGIADTVDYTDTDGSTKQAYYIGTTEGTDPWGMTQFVDMHLSTGSSSFLYVIDEANTPAGYVKLDEPIVRVVEVNGGDPNYANGVYTLTVENHREAQATVAVTANKQWSVPEGMDCPPVTLTLYKKTADGTVTAIDEVTLDGTAASETTENGITAAVNGWQVVWSGLSYADGTNRNEYFVGENALPGYMTSYSTTVSTLKVGTRQVGAALAEGYNLKRSVTVTNTAGFELPSTGGTGTRWFAPLGLLLMLAAAVLALCSRKKYTLKK